MDTLPTELLERVLRLLAPRDLILCRAVCARWRFVVRALEAADRAFVVDCGVDAVARTAHMGYSRHQDVLDAFRNVHADTYAHEVDADTRLYLEEKLVWISRMHTFDDDDDTPFMLIRWHMEFIARKLEDSSTSLYSVPCACGRPGAVWMHRGDVVEDDTETIAPHRRLVPLTQWRHLASDRALAQQLADVCGPLDARLLFGSCTFDYNGEWRPWFPYFLHVQSRPLGRVLARATSPKDIVHALTSDPELAEAFRKLLRDEASIEDWWSQSRESLDEYVDGWIRVRAKGISAASYVVRNMCYVYGMTYPWMAMSAEQLTAGLEAQQRHFDTVVAAFACLVRFPVVLSDNRGYYVCIVGLSPSANLVGVRVTLDSR